MLPASQVPMFVKNTKSSQPGLGIVKHLPDLYTNFSQVVGDSNFCQCLREDKQNLRKNPAVPSFLSGLCHWLVPPPAPV